MEIKDFSNEEFIECVELYSSSYKNKFNNENLSPVKISGFERTESGVSVVTSQLFMEKYLIDRIYKFTNKQNNLEAEIIELNQDNSVYNVTSGFRPLFRTITQNDLLKGEDWLSRLSYEEILCLVNKYYRECFSIRIEAHEQSIEHCRWVHLKDENDYYIDTIVFGDYGIGYNHYGKISKLNSRSVFDEQSLEFYEKIINKLNEKNKIKYTKQFILANKASYEKSNSSKEFFCEEMKKAEFISKKLIDNLNIKKQIKL